MTVLDTCPFCGSNKIESVKCEDPYPDVGMSFPTYVVLCYNCGATGQNKDYDMKEAEKAWNNRVKWS